MLILGCICLMSFRMRGRPIGELAGQYTYWAPQYVLLALSLLHFLLANSCGNAYFLGY
jgi:hypothetical protein